MNKKDLLRRLPKIDELMKEESLVVLAGESSSLLVTDAVRDVIAELRQQILGLGDDEADGFDAASLQPAAIAAMAAARFAENEQMKLYPLINATGTILHTNLGRAPLCKDALDNVTRVSQGYSTLEYNVAKGKRGSRHDLVGDLIVELTGAEDAMVVNNNASATMIVLATLGKGKEIVVSRGELVEIGGAFRIPDIMRQSGAFLQEVGTSNKTKPSDYEKAIVTEDMLREMAMRSRDDALLDDPRGIRRFETGALMKVHRSNYDIVGFTEEASLEQLVEIGHSHGLPVIFDMGNGLMLDMSEFGLNEPNVPASLATGIDVILFSGDKLLGGPQAGIIAGKREYIEAMKKHPLARALRVDKMTFAALEATLVKYRDRKLALRDIPVLNMISAGSDEMKAKAEHLAARIHETAGRDDIGLEIVPVLDQIGGGSAPMVRLPGWAVAVSDGSRSPDGIERSLRKADVPVIARINEDRLLLCVRTIADNELQIVADAFRA